MRTITSQRFALSSAGRVLYMPPPAEPRRTVPCLVIPLPIWYMVTPVGLPLGLSEELLPATPDVLVPSRVHVARRATGRTDSTLPQRSQSPAAGGACAVAHGAARASTKALRRMLFIRAACSDKTSNAEAVLDGREPPAIDKRSYRFHRSDRARPARGSPPAGSRGRPGGRRAHRAHRKNRCRGIAAGRAPHLRRE